MQIYLGVHKGPFASSDCNPFGLLYFHLFSGPFGPFYDFWFQYFFVSDFGLLRLTWNLQVWVSIGNLLKCIGHMNRILVAITYSTCQDQVILIMLRMVLGLHLYIILSHICAENLDTRPQFKFWGGIKIITFQTNFFWYKVAIALTLL